MCTERIEWTHRLMTVIKGDFSLICHFFFNVENICMYYLGNYRIHNNFKT